MELNEHEPRSDRWAQRIYAAGFGFRHELGQLGGNLSPISRVLLLLSLVILILVVAAVLFVAIPGTTIKGRQLTLTYYLGIIAIIGMLTACLFCERSQKKRQREKKKDASEELGARLDKRGLRSVSDGRQTTLFH